jgi:short-subunit dehydrogenase
VSLRRLCLVTGASAGIGAAFAREFARRGYDLALTARRAARLERLAEELKRDFGAEVLTLPADLADPAAPQAILDAIAAEGRTVAALVNNAGYGFSGNYAASDWAGQAAMLQVMLTSVCELTNKALPEMVRADFGRIVNVASLAGLIPASPGVSLYAPIKTFLVRFSQTLNVELRGTGVHVTALCPGFTHTEFHDVNNTREALERATPRFLWQSAEAVAALGYRAVEANRPVCVTGAPNRAVAALMKILPESVALRLIARHYRTTRWRP